MDCWSDEMGLNAGRKRAVVMGPFETGMVTCIRMQVLLLRRQRRLGLRRQSFSATNMSVQWTFAWYTFLPPLVDRFSLFFFPGVPILISFLQMYWKWPSYPFGLVVPLLLYF